MNWSDQYFQKAKKSADFLGNFPGVRAIFLSGSLATKKATKSSDIDIFVIAKRGQIWTARFFIVSWLKLSGQLASPKNHAGMICPNHFVSEDCLEIIEQDAYAAEMFSQNIPLYDPCNMFPQFIHKNERWISEFGFTFSVFPEKEVSKKSADFLHFRWKLLEKFLRVIQVWKIRQNPNFYKKEACIVLSDTELRFHPVPKSKK